MSKVFPILNAKQIDEEITNLEGLAEESSPCHEDNAKKILIDYERAVNADPENYGIDPSYSNNSY